MFFQVIPLEIPTIPAMLVLQLQVKIVRKSFSVASKVSCMLASVETQIVAVKAVASSKELFNTQNTAKERMDRMEQTNVWFANNWSLFVAITLNFVKISSVLFLIV